MRTLVLDVGAAVIKLGLSDGDYPTFVGHSEAATRCVCFQGKDEAEARRLVDAMLAELLLGLCPLTVQHRYVVVVETHPLPALVRRALLVELLRTYEAAEVQFVDAVAATLLATGCSDGLVVDVGARGIRATPVAFGRCMYDLRVGASIAAPSSSVVHTPIPPPPTLVPVPESGLGATACVDALRPLLSRPPRGRRAVSSLAPMTRAHEHALLAALSRCSTPAGEAAAPPAEVTAPAEVAVPGVGRVQPAPEASRVVQDTLLAPPRQGGGAGELDEDGVPALLLRAARGAPVDVRRRVLRNVVFAGGLADVPGFQARALALACRAGEAGSAAEASCGLAHALASARVVNPPAPCLWRAWAGAALAARTHALPAIAVAPGALEGAVPGLDDPCHPALVRPAGEQGGGEGGGAATPREPAPDASWSPRPGTEGGPGGGPGWVRAAVGGLARLGAAAATLVTASPLPPRHRPGAARGGGGGGGGAGSGSGGGAGNVQ